MNKKHLFSFKYVGRPVFLVFLEILDINVNEHLIITTEGYYSFADEGLI